MREKDDFGYDLTWLTQHSVNSEYTVEQAREQMNIYAHRDAQLAETGSTALQFNNLPYPVAMIGGFLRDIDMIPGSVFELYRFLEVGCGSAVKATMASDMFSYSVHAFDITDEHVAKSCETVKIFNQEQHVTVEQVCALTFDDYHLYDVIYLNRLFVGPETQLYLESRVWDMMSPNAFLILVNGLSTPGNDGDLIVSNDRGGAVYRKTYGNGD